MLYFYLGMGCFSLAGLMIMGMVKVYHKRNRPVLNQISYYEGFTVLPNGILEMKLAGENATVRQDTTKTRNERFSTRV